MDLFGKGRGLAPAGIAMAVAALLLAGAPWGLLNAGTRFVHEAGRSAYGGWFAAVLLIGSALTGATVLRATGRIFLGLGSAPNPEERASPSDDEQEQSSRPLWLMMAPIIVLLTLCLLPGSLAEAIAARICRDVRPRIIRTWAGSGCWDIFGDVGVGLDRAGRWHSEFVGAGSPFAAAHSGNGCRRRPSVPSARPTPPAVSLAITWCGSRSVWRVLP